MENIKTFDNSPISDYFDRYFNQIGSVTLDRAFDNSLFQLQGLDIGKLKCLSDKRYLPGKWTVKEILQHISDIERILTVGVLRFARNEESFIISFDEIAIAAAVNVNNKRIEQLLHEIETVRRATISLYKGFAPEDLLKTGIRWNNPISIQAMGFNIIGHQIHHLKIIEERYYPLLN